MFAAPAYPLTPRVQTVGMWTLHPGHFRHRLKTARRPRCDVSKVHRLLTGRRVFMHLRPTAHPRTVTRGVRGPIAQGTDAATVHNMRKECICAAPRTWSSQLTAHANWTPSSSWANPAETRPCARFSQRQASPAPVVQTGRDRALCEHSTVAMYRMAHSGEKCGDEH